MVDHNQTASGASPLATEIQRELEVLALRIVNEPAVRAARERARAAMLADPTSTTRDGAAGLDRALDQWVMGHTVAIINADPARPRFIWAIDNTAHAWFGHTYPGGAVAIDNPDNVNRTTPLGGAWNYVVEGRFAANPAAQTSFIITPAEEGQLRLGDPVAATTSRELQVNADGSFVLTIDRRPAEGRANHLQITEGALMLAVRDSHSDWRQQPTALTIRAVAGPAAAPAPAYDELVEAAATGLVDFVEFWLGFKQTFWNTPPFNELVGPLGRAGGWGFQAGGRFAIDIDHALVVTTTDGGAAYTGFQVSDAWTISPTPLFATTSRNRAQAQPNPDGSYTYVVSLTDPGIANWIDTAGLHEGWLMLRWQNLPPACDGKELLRSVDYVALDELESVLPTGTPRMDLQGRAAEIRARVHQYEKRTYVPG